MALDRTNQTFLGRWWWTVDRPLFFALVMLACVGAIMVTAASPPVAARIGLDPMYFIRHQYFFLVLALFVMFVLSMFDSVKVRRLAVIGFLASIFLMLLLPFLGVENKGAKRWLNIMGMSVQPSEFLKPCFAVVVAWVFSERHKVVDFPGYRIAIALYLLVVFLLVIQPDLGMTITVSFMFMLQFFLAGLPFFWVALMAGLGLMGLFGAYKLFPHVAKRIDAYLDPASSDNYQIAKSMEAFKSGGILGRGPGEGLVKQHIPDSHTDFIFAVAGEEYGVIVCLLIVALFAFIVLRTLSRVSKEKEFFTVLAVAGLIAQFGIQAIINMGVAVDLLPAKGMTLPFLSYGGSSLVAIALGMGMMLALTRRRYGKVG